MKKAIIILLSLILNFQSVFASTSILLFSSDPENINYTGTVSLFNTDKYDFYVFVGTPFNISSIIHASSLTRGNSSAFISYSGTDLYTDVQNRRYTFGKLKSFYVTHSGVRRIYGIKNN
jgi:hypothetical protein